MKYVIFSLVVLVAVIHSAFSILCYHCDANVQNCTEVRNCTNSSDTCSYHFSKYGGATEQKCSTNTTCQGIANSCGPSKLCLMKCCHSDHCNKDGPTMAPVTTATKNTEVITSRSPTTPTTPNTAFQPITSKKTLAVTMVIILISVL